MSMDNDPRLSIGANLRKGIRMDDKREVKPFCGKVKAKPRKINNDREEKLRDKVLEISKDGISLNEWEAEFIAGLIDLDAVSFSIEQEAMINLIYKERMV